MGQFKKIQASCVGSGGGFIFFYSSTPKNECLTIFRYLLLKDESLQLLVAWRVFSSMNTFLESHPARVL